MLFFIRDVDGILNLYNAPFLAVLLTLRVRYFDEFITKGAPLIKNNFSFAYPVFLLSFRLHRNRKYFLNFSINNLNGNSIAK